MSTVKAAQVKLLRAIQEGEVEPVGARKPVKVDVRLMSATNRDLSADVKSGRFREDLFYRLHVFPITVPPLRERSEDIPGLARHFLLRFAAEEGKRVRQLSAQALNLLLAHRWPGNVRQLENTIFRAVVLAEGDEIGINEFPQIAAQVAAGAEVPIAPVQPAPAEHGGAAGGLALHDAPQAAGFGARPIPGGLALLDAAGEVRPLEEIEREAIKFAIAHYRGQMSEVARRLHIGRSTLYRKLESLNIDEGDSQLWSDVAAG